MRVDVSYSHGRTRFQPRPGGGLLAQLAGFGAEGRQVSRHLGVDHISEVGVQGSKKVARGKVTILIDRLVARRAGVAGLTARQLPDDPVGGFDKAVRLAVDLRRLF